MIFGKISSDDLQLLLAEWPRIEAEVNEIRPMLAEDIGGMFSGVPVQGSWCQYYEMPFVAHIDRVQKTFGLAEHVQAIASAPSPIQEAVRFTREVEKAFTAEEVVGIEVARQLFPGVYLALGLSLSVYNSLRSLMVFGRSLNDLVCLVRANGRDADAALFCAVKIDPSVLGCPSVLSRLSRAVLTNDQVFLKALKRSLLGKLTKREDKTYQRMRLVLYVLSDSGAGRLSGDQLYKLFVEELRIYSKTLEGDPVKALRKFADQYIKAASTT